MQQKFAFKVFPRATPIARAMPLVTLAGGVGGW